MPQLTARSLVPGMASLEERLIGRPEGLRYGMAGYGMAGASTSVVESRSCTRARVSGTFQ